MKPSLEWDLYFRQVCDAVAKKSPCLSRQIGAILVRDKSIVATGYNGPPRGVPHCDPECPRKAQGFKSGEGLHLCPATHAEVNCVVNAARLGVSTLGTTLYMNCLMPCVECLKVLINAGVREIVIDDITPYSVNRDLVHRLLIERPLTIRRFAFVHLMDKAAGGTDGKE